MTFKRYLSNNLQVMLDCAGELAMQTSFLKTAKKALRKFGAMATAQSVAL
jgi:hypothetical protein